MPFSSTLITKGMAKKTPPPFLFLSIFFLFLPIFSQSEKFIFNGFNGSDSSLIREDATVLKPTGLLRLTNQTKNIKGHAFYSKSILMIDKTDPSKQNATSFSTNFVFAIVPPSNGQGGYGLAFTLSPEPDFPGGAAGHYMGIFNEANNGNATNHVVAVEFDSVQGFNARVDDEGNHVGININSMSSIATATAKYHSDEYTEKEMVLESGNPIQVWIDYDGIAKILNVTIAPLDVQKPSQPLIDRFKLDLTPIIKETMYVGFTASTGPEKASGHYIMGWSFSTGGAVEPLNISSLPSPPQIEKVHLPYDTKLIALIAALATMTVLLVGMLICFLKKKGRFHHEELEDWELDCPHRFQYKDLYRATKGFKESEIIGIGGFGVVFKGVLPGNGAEVAVKKITQSSVQGLREFAAEIESLGRLRHKNLVNLQGWCKKKSDLLLIYEYIPYGSLYSLLYEPKNGFVLSWEQRFNIIKGIASGLLYLHEEWEQVVIHRDVKSSNVLIDADLNARLGDFGLARLYDHGTVSHTTNVVGTIGYIAPELARNGRASTSSDVFAYGVLLLEIASGRKPTDRSSNFFLVDWVLELQQLDHILESVDPNLGSTYVAEEANLVLQLGLLCTHNKPEFRPGMRQVLRYLNRDDSLVPSSIEMSRSFDSRDEIYSRFREGVSSDTTGMSSQHPSSASAVSFSSIEIGR